MKRVLQDVLVSQILDLPKDGQLRRSKAEMDELAASIKRRGIEQQIELRRDKDGYRIVDGRHRTAALVLLGRKVIPAVVRDQDDREAALSRVEANRHRKDLSPYQEALEYQACITAGTTQTALAKELGVTQSHVSKRLALLKAPKAIAELAGTAVPVENVPAYAPLVEHPKLVTPVVELFLRDGTAMPWQVESACIESGHACNPMSARWLVEHFRCPWDDAYWVTENRTYRKNVAELPKVELKMGHYTIALCLDPKKVVAFAKETLARKPAAKAEGGGRPSSQKDPKRVRLERIGRRARALQREALTKHLPAAAVDQDALLKELYKRVLSSLQESPAKVDVAAMEAVTPSDWASRACEPQWIEENWTKRRDELDRYLAARLFFDARNGGWDAEKGYCVTDDQVGVLATGKKWREIHRMAVQDVDGNEKTAAKKPTKKTTAGKAKKQTAKPGDAPRPKPSKEPAKNTARAAVLEEHKAKPWACIWSNCRERYATEKECNEHEEKCPVKLAHEKAEKKRAKQEAGPHRR